MKEKTYKWLLIRIEDSTVLNTSQMEAPVFGNNGHETTESDIFKWHEWNKPLPGDIDEKQYTLTELEELYKDWKPE